MKFSPILYHPAGFGYLIAIYSKINFLCLHFLKTQKEIHLFAVGGIFRRSVWFARPPRTRPSYDKIEAYISTAQVSEPITRKFLTTAATRERWSIVHGGTEKVAKLLLEHVDLQCSYIVVATMCHNYIIIL